MANPVNPRVVLRRAVNQHLKTAADLEAFLLDYFPRTAREISSGMERTAQVNLLLSCESTDAIRRALEQQLGNDVLTIAQLHADLGLSAGELPVHGSEQGADRRGGIGSA